jgi:hypothetical protein
MNSPKRVEWREVTAGDSIPLMDGPRSCVRACARADGLLGHYCHLLSPRRLFSHPLTGNANGI